MITQSRSGKQSFSASTKNVISIDEVCRLRCTCLNKATSWQKSESSRSPGRMRPHDVTVEVDDTLDNARYARRRTGVLVGLDARGAADSETDQLCGSQHRTICLTSTRGPSRAAARWRLCQGLQRWETNRFGLKCETLNVGESVVETAYRPCTDSGGRSERFCAWSLYGDHEWLRNLEALILSRLRCVFC